MTAKPFIYCLVHIDTQQVEVFIQLFSCVNFKCIFYTVFIKAKGAVGFTRSGFSPVVGDRWGWF
jgi:hypothetical protein